MQTNNLIKNINLLTINKWLQFNYTLDNKLLTKNNLINAFNQFCDEVIFKLNKDQCVSIIFKIKIGDEYYRNISNIQNLNIDNYHSVLEIFIEYWNIKDNEYLSYNISEIYFMYKINILNSKYKPIIKPQVSKPDIMKEKTNFLRLGGFNLPNTMDLFQWGDVVFFNNDTKALVFKKRSKAEYHITFIGKNSMNIKYKLNDKVLLEFTDILRDLNNLSTFTRIIQNNKYYFEKGEIISKIKLHKVNKILTLKKQPYYINKFITLDIETKVINNVIIPYAISYFDGKTIRSFYETSYMSPEEMVKTALKTLLIRKYHNYKIYVHNLSNFDGIFIFKLLMEISSNIKPIINEGKFINITVKFNDKYNLQFRDSYLMLPSSLKKLAKSFKVEDKSIFPYKFVNNDTIFNNYSGDVPNFEFFDNISRLEYNQYCNEFKNKNWNLRTETLKYCNQDVRTLYLVLEAFFKDNYEQTRVNASKCVSLPSLAMANFRTNFMSNENIPIIIGEMYHFIKKSYSGGAVDVYKPYGKNIYRYDVNSLYPFIMRNNPMPVGNPTYIEGDSIKIEALVKDKTKFSFVEVEVKCPSDLNIPLLLVKHKTQNGIRSIAPVGSWNGVYTSIEINRALELGYNFKYHKAVYFQTENIFKDYVDYYYNLKKNSDKNSPNYTISKLMLNSLYGRFGMNPYLNKHIVVNEGEHLKLMEIFNVIDVYSLLNGKEIVTYENKNESHINDTNTLVSIAVAAAITAGARVYMSKFKNMNNITIYYSDTDSIDIDRPLDPKCVGGELGQMKLEHIFKEAVYLAPKLYGGITSEYEYIKVKGLKTPLPFNELLSLLKMNTKLEKPNQKWYKSLSKGQITIKDEIYTVSITENKRNLIFDENNYFIDTKPIVLG